MMDCNDNKAQGESQDVSEQKNSYGRFLFINIAQDIFGIGIDSIREIIEFNNITMILKNLNTINLNLGVQFILFYSALILTLYCSKESLLSNTEIK